MIFPFVTRITYSMKVWRSRSLSTGIGELA